MTREESNKIKWLSFAMTISIVLYHANGGAYNLADEKFVDEILNRLIFAPFDGSLWYLMSLFILSLIVPLSIKVLRFEKIVCVLYLLLCIYSFVVIVVTQKFFPAWNEA